jgi:hypothetical protein
LDIEIIDSELLGYWDIVLLPVGKRSELEMDVLNKAAGCCINSRPLYYSFLFIDEAVKVAT